MTSKRCSFQALSDFDRGFRTASFRLSEECFLCKRAIFLVYVAEELVIGEVIPHSNLLLPQAHKAHEYPGHMI
jgi:hypothetical protein